MKLVEEISIYKLQGDLQTSFNCMDYLERYTIDTIFNNNTLANQNLMYILRDGL